MTKPADCPAGDHPCPFEEQPHIDPAAAATKDAVKEALKEWLDEKFLLVGKWTVNGVLAAGLAALVYVILMQQGWKHD